MRVVGLGLRASAGADEIASTIARCGPCVSVAVPADKAGHAGLVAAAARLRIPIAAVDAHALQCADAHVRTRSRRIERLKGVGSIAEAAALAAAGQGARIVMARIVAAGGRVTAAVAEGEA